MTKSQVQRKNKGINGSHYATHLSFYDDLGSSEENMKNIKIVIEYDGKKFNGWQKQPNKPNIQGEIEKAIEEVTGEVVELYASR